MRINIEADTEYAWKIRLLERLRAGIKARTLCPINAAWDEHERKTITRIIENVAHAKIELRDNVLVRLWARLRKGDAIHLIGDTVVQQPQELSTRFINVRRD